MELMKSSTKDLKIVVKGSAYGINSYNVISNGHSVYSGFDYAAALSIYNKHNA